MSNELVADCPASSFLHVIGVASLLAARSLAGKWTRWWVACKVASHNPRLSLHWCESTKLHIQTFCSSGFIEVIYLGTFFFFSFSEIIYIWMCYFSREDANIWIYNFCVHLGLLFEGWITGSHKKETAGRCYIAPGQSFWIVTGH
jgi:hypothetical protein